MVTRAHLDSAVVSTAGVEQARHIAVRDAKALSELVQQVRPKR